MSKKPVASVIIATCRRPQLLLRCLKTLSAGAQTAHFDDYEVIVADDDPQRSAIDFLRQNAPWVRITEGPSRGPAGARNAAVAFAEAPLLIFTDDDCIPSPTFVESYVKTAAPLMYGPTTCRDGCNDPFDTAPYNPDGRHTFGCNLACSKELFEAMGGFDEGFLFYGFEDIDFFATAKKLCYIPQFVSEAAIDHPPRHLAPVVKRVQMLKNYFRYQLKHSISPSLSDVLTHFIGNWRDRLRLPANMGRRLQMLGSLLAEFFLTLALFDRLMVSARASLDAHK